MAAPRAQPGQLRVRHKILEAKGMNRVGRQSAKGLHAPLDLIRPITAVELDLRSRLEEVIDGLALVLLHFGQALVRVLDLTAESVHHGHGDAEHCVLAHREGRLAAIAMDVDEARPGEELVELTELETSLADALGEARLVIPIPSSTALGGVRFFGQWFQLDGSAPFLTTEALAMTIN